MIARRQFRLRGFLVFVSIVASGVVCSAQTVIRLPHGSGYRLASKTVAVEVHTSRGKLSGLRIQDLFSPEAFDMPEAFALTMRDGTVFQSSGMAIERPIAIENLSPQPPGGTAASREPGKRLCAEFTVSGASGHLRWCVVMRAKASYFRQVLTIGADKEMPIAQVRLLDFHDPQAHVAGTVKGSPVVDGRMFFGFEHPLSWSRVLNGDVQAGISRDLPLSATQSVTYSAVIGVAQPGQMRRAFLAYLEDERPRAYSPFLHYNSWYDLSYGGRYDEAGALDRIHAFGTELVEKRHVPVNSYLFDDGWDNPNSLWEFSSGFPNGFTAVARAAAKHGSGIGVWLSPWGGYQEAKKERVAYGRSHGYEIVNGGYALSGPKYYQRFQQICLKMVEQYGVNMFKFDGTGNANHVFPGSAFDSDFDAAIHLIRKIREQKPGIFINLTTGTYPSPFWLFYADSIWRGGRDHDFAGVGPSRQRWITYRDEQTYRNIVQGGPLFPLNSLMLHGIIYAKLADGLNSDPHGDFANEVQSYFGSGTQLQEMYVTPSLLSAANWDELSRAALWARQHASVLKDTHWIDGDPGKLQVYGWAAWNPTGWIVTLRNPSDHPQDFSLDLETALELPQGAPRSYIARNPFGDAAAAPLNLRAGVPVTLHLRAFEVRTLESGAAEGRGRP